MTVKSVSRILVCATALVFAWHAIPATAQDEQHAAETELDPKGVAAWERLVGVMGAIPAPPTNWLIRHPVPGTNFRMDYVDYAVLNELTPGGYIERRDQDKIETDPKTDVVTNHTIVTRNVTKLFWEASLEQTSKDSIGISSKRFTAGANVNFGWGFGKEAIILFSETGLADATSQIENTFQSNGLRRRNIDDQSFWYNYEDDRADNTNKPVGPTFNNPFSWLGGYGPMRTTVAQNALISVRHWESAEEVAKALSGRTKTVADLHAPLAALDLLRDLLLRGHQLVQMRYMGWFGAQGTIESGGIIADIQYGREKLVLRGRFFESESAAKHVIAEENSDLTTDEIEEIISAHTFRLYGAKEKVVAFTIYEDNGMEDPWHMNLLYAEAVQSPYP